MIFSFICLVIGWIVFVKPAVRPQEGAALVMHTVSYPMLMVALVALSSSHSLTTPIWLTPPVAYLDFNKSTTV